MRTSWQVDKWTELLPFDWADRYTPTTLATNAIIFQQHIIKYSSAYYSGQSADNHVSLMSSFKRELTEDLVGISNKSQRPRFCIQT